MIKREKVNLDGKQENTLLKEILRTIRIKQKWKKGTNYLWKDAILNAIFYNENAPIYERNYSFVNRRENDVSYIVIHKNDSITCHCGICHREMEFIFVLYTKKNGAEVKIFGAFCMDCKLFDKEYYSNLRKVIIE